MIKHIVFFKIKGYPLDTKKEVAKDLSDALNNLPAKIDEIKDLEVGTSITIGDENFDLALTVTLEDQQALESYRVHPEHQKVVKMIVEKTDERTVVDYIIQ